MTEDDLRKVLRDFRTSVVEDLEAVHRRADEMESGILNKLRSIGRRLERIEKLSHAH